MKKFISIIAILLIYLPSQAQIKISDLPTISGNNSDSLWLPVLQNGANRKARGYQVNGSVKSDSTTFTKSGCRTIVKVWRNGSVQQTDTFYKPKGIISGGGFTPVNDSTYNLQATTYTIGCITFSISAQNITLNGNSQNSTGRYDVFGVDNTGSPFILQGANATNPVVPLANTNTQIPLYTVFFPPLSDSGITNIYNTTVFNMQDSTAYRNVFVLDSFRVIICDLTGRCDTLLRIYEGPKYVDSLRRSNDSVFALKNGTWRFQFKDSTGGGSFIPDASINPFVNNKKFFRHGAGVIRGYASGNNQPITWGILDSTTKHTMIQIDSVKGFANEIRVYYPKVKNINAFIVAPDETLAGAGVICGASVGDASASIYAYTTALNCGQLTGNTTSWTNGGLSLTGLSYNTTTGLTIFSPTTGGTGSVYAGSPEVLGTQISYVGAANRSIRRVYSGLSGQLIGFYLVDSANNIITGNLASTDIVAISVPRTRVVPIPAETTSSNGYPSDILTSTANFWIIFSMELYLIGYPLPGTSTVRLEWQTEKSGSANYATNYRLTRAPLSSPNSETTIFNGFVFGGTDTGLTANTTYIYRLYATVLGTESLVTNEKVTTNK